MNSFKIFLLILFVGFGLGACKNFLTPDLDNQYTKDRFYNDPAWALGVMLQGYVTSNAFPADYQFEEVATDDAVTNDPTNTYLRMATGEWSALFDPTNVWSSSYFAILNLNYFLSIIDDVTWSWQDTVRNRIFIKRYKAETFALRGYYYYKLLEHYGGIGSNNQMMGVPIINGVLTSNDDWKVQRSTFQESFDQALSDLNKGIASLPYTYGDIPNPSTPEQVAYNRINGTGLNVNLMDGRIATAYKGKLFLLGASPAFNGGTNYDPVKLDSAVRIFGTLITKNGGLNSMGTDPIFWDDNTDMATAPGNTDILWRANYSSRNSLEGANYPPSLYGSGRINPTQNLVDAFPTKKGYPINYPDTLVSGYFPSNPYANRDIRLNVCILYNGGKHRVNGSLGSNNVINTQADNATGNNDGLNQLSQYSTRTGYYLKKLLRVDVNYNPSSRTSQNHAYVRMRWTEIFLNFAEAANELYGPDGDGGFGFTPRQIIQKIRARGYVTRIGSTNYTAAGITQPDTYLTSITGTAAMRELIRNERRIELCFEGFRFWDLRRWNVPLTKLTEPAKGVYITTNTAVTPNKTVYDYTSTDKGINPVEKRVYQSHMYYGPIPYLETKKYPGFIQNMGW